MWNESSWIHQDEGIVAMSRMPVSVLGNDRNDLPSLEDQTASLVPGDLVDVPQPEGDLSEAD